MDDTFVIQKEEDKQNFLNHINSVDPTIKFKVENTREDGAIPFLDTQVKPEADNTLSFTVYRKAPPWISICSGTATTTCWQSIVLLILLPTGLEQCAVSQNFTKKLTTSGRHSATANIPDGPWTRWKEEVRQLTRERDNSASNQATDGVGSTTETKTIGHIAIPYTQGLCENLKKMWGKYGIYTDFKGNKAIKNVLVAQGTRTPWGRTVEQSTGSSVWSLHVMKNI